MGRRHEIYGLLLLYAYLAHVLRQVFSLTVVCIRKIHKQNMNASVVNWTQHHHHAQYHHRHDHLWSDSTSSWLLGIYNIGIFLAALPISKLLKLFGMKKVLVSHLVLASVVALCMIPSVTNEDTWWTALFRMLTGYCIFPLKFAARSVTQYVWSPQSELPMVSGYAGIMYGLGTITANIGVAATCDVFNDWISVYYAIGFVYALTVVVTYFRYENKPEDDKLISEKELDKILKERIVLKDDDDVTQPVPIKSMLKSRAIWLLMYIVCLQSWQQCFVNFYSPMLLYSRLPSESLLLTSVLCSIPHFAYGLVSMASGHIFTFLVRRVGRNLAMKVCICLSMFLSSAAATAMVHLPNYPWISVVCLIVIKAALGLSKGPGNNLPIYLAGHHNASVISLTTVISSLLVTAFSFIVAHHIDSQGGWNMILSESSALWFLGAVLWLAFGETELQHWAMTENERTLYEPLA